MHVPGNPSPLPADGIPADLDINPPYVLAHGKHAAAPSASRPPGRCRSSGCHGLDANHAATARRISSATETPSDSARRRSTSAKLGGNANAKGFSLRRTPATQIGQRVLCLPTGPPDGTGEPASRFAGSPWHLDVYPPCPLVDLGHSARATRSPRAHSITVFVVARCPVGADGIAGQGPQRLAACNMASDLLFYLERTTGFEPATPTLARLCSTS